MSVLSLWALLLPVGSGSALAHGPRLGLQLGAPVGLSAAVDLGPNFALHLSLSPPSDRSELGARLDLIYRLPELGGDISSIAAAHFWFGPGLRWTLDPGARSDLGARVPFGLSVWPEARDWELYAEIAPVLVLTPDLSALVEAGVGLRFDLF